MLILEIQMSFCNTLRTMGTGLAQRTDETRGHQGRQNMMKNVGKQE
jgi:hypothetical protein